MGLSVSPLISNSLLIVSVKSYSFSLDFVCLLINGNTVSKKPPPGPYWFSGYKVFLFCSPSCSNSLFTVSGKPYSPSFEPKDNMLLIEYFVAPYPGVDASGVYLFKTLKITSLSLPFVSNLLFTVSEILYSPAPTV